MADVAQRKVTRRKFLKAAGAVAGLAAISSLPVGSHAGFLSSLVKPVSASSSVPQVALAGKAIGKYLHALPHFVGARVTGNTLTVTAEEFQQKVLPDMFYAALPAPVNPGDLDFMLGTYVWGYSVGGRPRLYPGFTVEAQQGVANTMTYVNSLPGSPVLQNYITVDQTLEWANPLGDGNSPPSNRFVPYGKATVNNPSGLPAPVPISTHLHGGEVQSGSDGGPDAWFTNSGAPAHPGVLYGPGYRTIAPPPVPGNAAVYYYPNMQEAATLWFHDHALGVTRTNVYAGLAAFYFLRDAYDTGVAGTGLNLPAGLYEIEIVIQDRQFDTNGQWLFPDGSPPGLMGAPPNPAVHPFWIPEFLGDAIVVNGRTWPFLNVEPRRYRFRFLDGSNARFYSMRLENKLLGTPGPVFWQIGTDGGLLDAPVKLDPLDPVKPLRLLLAPGERADIIIDFSGFTGQTLTLRNSARAPFPKGTTADPQTVGQIMEFRVVLPLSSPDTSFDPSVVGATLRGGLGKPPIIRRLADPATGTLAAGITPVLYRQLTLNEVMGLGPPGGPLQVILNNTGIGSFGGPVTESPQKGSTEVWEIINMTADAHPIHLHLVQFQLLNRQAYNVNKYTTVYTAAFTGGVVIPAQGPPMPYTQNQTPNAVPARRTIGGNPDVTPYLQGPIKLPNPNEAGWKDTVIMYPGEVTRIVVQFTKQDGNAFDFDPTIGPGYVWHCHIIDHEDNEMMRRYKVGTAPQAIAAAGTAGQIPLAGYAAPVLASAVAGAVLLGGARKALPDSETTIVSKEGSEE